MSVSTIGSNTSSIADLLNQRRQSLKAMEAAVQSGNLGAAQQALTSVQGDTASIQASSTGAFSASTSSPGASTTDGSSQGGNPYRSSLATDLTSLSSALQSGDTARAQTALTIVQTDLTAATQGLQATGGAHHGHHHHGGGGGAGASSSQQTADSLFGTSTTSGSTPASSSTSTSSTGPFASAASSTSGDVLSQLLASLETSASASSST